MLEARNLHKEYKTKNGPTVKALDGINIKFAETGMVFILGKSGSGKSTLLNVLGGLDKYDEGEVIVKGKSSKDFTQSDFDSYRNTFIGFIFQDYNILEEFTISKNIGLALELQGKKADKKTIDDLMEQVDLKGYGKRKPNTLSGGQRQRVAIARALVKNPEIIMADEPTGALDSNTGKQVLDTLKKLSKTKLVLIVSHDREFAERYGDRIIELADGKIISDVSKYKSAPKNNDGLEIVDDKILTIKKGTKIDTKKAKVLNDFISNSNEDIIVSIDSVANKEFKKFAMIDDEGNKESFKITDIIDYKDYDPNMFKLIKSRLPGKDSLKMGASGLKTKPIRLFFTIILSAIAFALFGLADTMGSYNKVDNTVVSIKDSKINYASFKKGLKEEPDDKWYQDVKLSQADYQYLSAKMEELDFYPVFSLDNSSRYASFSSYIYDNEGISEYDSLYRSALYGFMELSEDNLDRVGSLVYGRLANTDDEIVISKYTYEIFKKGGYKTNANAQVVVSSYADIIDKKITLSSYSSETFTIVGIIDTDCDLSRYSKINEEGFGQKSSDYMLRQEFSDFISTSYHALGYLNKGYYNNNISDNSLFISVDSDVGMHGLIANSKTDSWGDQYHYIAAYSDDIAKNIVYFDSNKQGIAQDEVVISLSALENYEFDVNGYRVSYSTMTNSWCRGQTFDEQYWNLLNQYDLGGYYNEILSYYGRFDRSNYVYDPTGTLWDSSKWYGPTLSNEQMNDFDNFFQNFNPTYCIDINEYFNSTEINNKLTNNYNIRIQTDDGVSSFEEYKEKLVNRYYDPSYWPSYYEAITSEEQEIVNGANNFMIRKIMNYLPKNFYYRTNVSYDEVTTYTIVGIYNQFIDENNRSSKAIISDKILSELKDSIGGVYNFIIARLDYSNESIVKSLVEFTYDEGDKVVYSLQNPVMSTMKEVNDMIETLSQVFLYIGIGFAVFAALLLLNFITISISYKKREIGVLRAIGARGMDVFKIFFNEAFIIAFINFILACIGSTIVCAVINNVIRTDYDMLITILNIGIRQFVLMFGVSLIVAFVSSFFPVYSIARKKPIDAIRNS